MPTITGQEEFELHLTVLAVPGCPNVALLEEQLAACWKAAAT
jgi:hypothetical protein